LIRIGVLCLFSPAQRANALSIFSEVRQFKERAKRANNDPKFLESKRAQQRAEVIVRRFGRGELPCQLTNLLDEIERIGTLETADHVAKHTTQKVDFAAKLIIVAHGSIRSPSRAANLSGGTKRMPFDTLAEGHFRWKMSGRCRDRLVAAATALV
jgi:hypothetical protein